MPYFTLKIAFIQPGGKRSGNSNFASGGQGLFL
jgi:hypothetical protein